MSAPLGRMPADLWKIIRMQHAQVQCVFVLLATVLVVLCLGGGVTLYMYTSVHKLRDEQHRELVAGLRGQIVALETLNQHLQQQK